MPKGKQHRYKTAQLVEVNYTDHTLVQANQNYRAALANYFDDHEKYQFALHGWAWKTPLAKVKAAARNYFELLDNASQGIKDLGYILKLATEHSSFIKSSEDDPDAPDNEHGCPITLIYKLNELGAEAGNLVLDNLNKTRGSANSLQYKTILKHTSTFIANCIKTSRDYAGILSYRAQTESSSNVTTLLKKCIEQADFALLKIADLNQVAMKTGASSNPFTNKMASHASEVNALKLKALRQLNFCLALKDLCSEASQAEQSHIAWDWRDFYNKLEQHLMGFIPDIATITQACNELEKFASAVNTLPASPINMNKTQTIEAGGKGLADFPNLSNVSIKLITRLVELIFKMGKHLIERFPEDQSGPEFDRILHTITSSIRLYSSITLVYASDLYHAKNYQASLALCNKAIVIGRICINTVGESIANQHSLTERLQNIINLHGYNQAKISSTTPTNISTASEEEKTVSSNSSKNHEKKVREALKKQIKAIEENNITFAELEQRKQHLIAKSKSESSNKIKNKIAEVIKLIEEKIDELNIQERSFADSPTSSLNSSLTDDGNTTDESDLSSLALVALSDDGDSMSLDSDDLEDEFIQAYTKTIRLRIQHQEQELKQDNNTNNNKGSEDRLLETKPESGLQAEAESEPMFCDLKPKCLEQVSSHTSRFSPAVESLSDILKKINCSAFLYGSAIYKANPGDLDILIPKQNMGPDKAQQLIWHILQDGGKLVAKYAKNGSEWLTYKLAYKGVEIDIITSPLSIEEHARTLDFTVSAMHFDLQRMQMRQPVEASYIKHFNQKRLVAISDPLTMIQKDPTIILRAIRAQASSGFRISNRLFEAMETALEKENLFENIIIDKLWLELEKLFFSGNNKEILESFSKHPIIFQKLFDATNKLKSAESKYRAENYPASLTNLITIMIERDPSLILRAIHTQLSSGINMPDELPAAIKNGFSQRNLFLNTRTFSRLCIEVENLFSSGEHTQKALSLLGAEWKISYSLFSAINRFSHDMLRIPREAEEKFFNNHHALTIALQKLVLLKPVIILRVIQNNVQHNMPISQELSNAIKIATKTENLFFRLPAFKLYKQISKLACAQQKEKLFLLLQEKFNIFDQLFITINSLATSDIWFTQARYNIMLAMLEQDPGIILRYLHLRITASNVKSSQELIAAVNTCFNSNNNHHHYFQNFDADTIYKQFDQFVFYGNACLFIDVLASELNLFDNVFRCTQQLTPEQKQACITKTRLAASAHDQKYVAGLVDGLPLSFLHTAIQRFALSASDKTSTYQQNHQATFFSSNPVDSGHTPKNSSSMVFSSTTS